MSGQAESAPESVDDLAQFLVDNPTADGTETEQPDPEPKQPKGGADNSESETDEDSPDEDPEATSDEEEDDESEEAKSQTSGLKFKVPIKGDDGADTTIEVDEKELIAGYQRHADYTRKTQQLGERERQAYEVVTQELNKGRDTYLQKAQAAHLAIRHLAALKTDAEMATLARVDPSEWATEVERVKAINNVLASIEDGMRQEAQVSHEQEVEQAKQAAAKGWETLRKEGVDRNKLGEIFLTVHKAYGVPQKRFDNITDPALVLIMRDAVAYRELKEKTVPATKQKVQAAPKLPPARQSVPQREQVNKRLNERFKTRRANVDDLASFLHTNKL